MKKTWTEHMNNLRDLRAALEAVALFKPTYKTGFSAVENTLAKLAAAEGPMPVLKRIKKQVQS